MPKQIKNDRAKITDKQTLKFLDFNDKHVDALLTLKKKKVLTAEDIRELDFLMTQIRTEHDIFKSSIPTGLNVLRSYATDRNTKNYIKLKTGENYFKRNEKYFKKKREEYDLRQDELDQEEESRETERQENIDRQEQEAIVQENLQKRKRKREKAKERIIPDQDMGENAPTRTDSGMVRTQLGLENPSIIDTLMEDSERISKNYRVPSTPQEQRQMHQAQKDKVRLNTRWQDWNSAFSNLTLKGRYVYAGAGTQFLKMLRHYDDPSNRASNGQDFLSGFIHDLGYYLVTSLEEEHDIDRLYLDILDDFARSKYASDDDKTDIGRITTMMTAKIKSGMAMTDHEANKRRPEQDKQILKHILDEVANAGPKKWASDRYRKNVLKATDFDPEDLSEFDEQTVYDFDGDFDDHRTSSKPQTQTQERTVPPFVITGKQKLQKHEQEQRQRQQQQQQEEQQQAEFDEFLKDTDEDYRESDDEPWFQTEDPEPEPQPDGGNNRDYQRDYERRRNREIERDRHSAIRNRNNKFRAYHKGKLRESRPHPEEKSYFRSVRSNFGAKRWLRPAFKDIYDQIVKLDAMRSDRIQKLEEETAKELYHILEGQGEGSIESELGLNKVNNFAELDLKNRYNLPVNKKLWSSGDNGRFGKNQLYTLDRDYYPSGTNFLGLSRVNEGVDRKTADRIGVSRWFQKGFGRKREHGHQTGVKTNQPKHLKKNYTMGEFIRETPQMPRDPIDRSDFDLVKIPMEKQEPAKILNDEPLGKVEDRDNKRFHKQKPKSIRDRMFFKHRNKNLYGR